MPNRPASPGVADAIVRTVAKFYDLELAEMLGERRWANLVIARQLAALLIRERTQLSLPQIGRLMGGRDHTTILKGLDSLGHKLLDDPDLRRQLEAIELQLDARLPRLPA